MRTIIFLTVSIFVFPLYSQELNIFVSAHPDDWQLFMNPNAFHALDSLENKAVFIHTTAGDAGNVMDNNAYYAAREEGSLRAIRFMVNAHGNKDGYGNDTKKRTISLNSHPIIQHSYGNARAYFLRLHDGFIVKDSMYEHPQSLRKFYAGEIKSITAIDESTTYNSLDDLKQTLKDLIDEERKGYETVTLHLAETDSEINPGDHPDHLHSSKIFQEIAKEYPDIEVYLYEEYATGQKPVNLFVPDQHITIGTWGATASGLSDSGHYPTWDRGHNSWLGKQYFRKKPKTTE
ncbi:MAG: PIG-L family deacetylase [Flavobacteriaceae bacterium]|nr:PIG-L family deacetylase [Flavobacteriaceae bacterium]